MGGAILVWKGQLHIFFVPQSAMALNSSQDRTCSCPLEEAAMAILEPHAGNPGTDAHSIRGDAIAKLCPFQLSNLINIPLQFP